MVVDGYCESFTSPPIQTEVQRVLVKKFGWSTAEVSLRLAKILSVTTVVVPSEPLKNLVVDDADHRILECAVEAHADYIVSGDNHLLNLGVYAGISVVTCRQFHAELVARQPLS
jgi:putative PIN family toxin of toxin-antitoxin system